VIERDSIFDCFLRTFNTHSNDDNPSRITCIVCVCVLFRNPYFMRRTNDKWLLRLILAGACDFYELLFMIMHCGEINHDTSLCEDELLTNEGTMLQFNQHPMLVSLAVAALDRVRLSLHSW
jgi:hypothetical protein